MRMLKGKKVKRVLVQKEDTAEDAESRDKREGLDQRRERGLKIKNLREGLDQRKESKKYDNVQRLLPGGKTLGGICNLQRIESYRCKNMVLFSEDTLYKGWLLDDLMLFIYVS